MLTNREGKPWSESGFQGAWGKATMRAGIRGLTFHDLRGTAVVTLARAGCNEVEIYSITGHKPGDVRAILTAHYLPRDRRGRRQCDCETESVQVGARRSKGGRKSPDYAPDRAKNREGENGKIVSDINWLGRQDSNLGMAESKSAALPLGYAPIPSDWRQPLGPAAAT